MIPESSGHPSPGFFRWAALLIALALGLTGCRSSYYAMMESFGKQKRDLLRDALTHASEENQEAATQFKDALAQLQALTGFHGSELEKKYNAFKSQYEDCVGQADRVHDRVKKVERVATDLFAEWAKEIEEITTPGLRSRSQEKLKDTQARYEQLHAALTRSMASMDPVLTQMKDYVLYLKHNLNAQAIGSLKSEMLSIENEIGQLIRAMNHSVQETAAFLSQLPE